MPFLKFSRDKRGYENFYLIEPPSGGRRGGKARPRLLFWFRTPPQVKVGRAPFSDEVRKMVEAQNPGMTFDWARIMATPIPPPDADHWRERRRIEKAARRAAREVDADAEDVPVAEEVPVTIEAQVAEAEPVDAPAAEAEAVEAETSVAASDAQGITPPGQRRRRRRRGRRGRHDGPDVAGQPVAQTTTDASAREADAADGPGTPPTNEV